MRDGLLLNLNPKKMVHPTGGFFTSVVSCEIETTLGGGSEFPQLVQV